MRQTKAQTVLSWKRQEEWLRGKRRKRDQALEVGGPEPDAEAAARRLLEECGSLPGPSPSCLSCLSPMNALADYHRANCQECRKEIRSIIAMRRRGTQCLYDSLTDLVAECLVAECCRQTSSPEVAAMDPLHGDLRGEETLGQLKARVRVEASLLARLEADSEPVDRLSLIHI